MDNQHTPGPWHVLRMDGTVKISTSETLKGPGLWICKMVGDPLDEPSVLPDARLIAAAPTMYAFVEARALEGCPDAVAILREIDGGAP